MNNKNNISLRAIYDNHYCQMVFYVKQIVKSTSTAEDIVQDLFVKLLSNPAVNNINIGFLYVCLKNSALNYVSTKKYKSEVRVDTFQFHPADEVTDIVELAEREEKLRRVISDLTPKCKEVLRKIYFDRMKYAEVAKEMNLSFHTVKSHMNIAFSTIKKRMNSLPSILVLF